GVNTLGAADAQGINFAIAIDQAKPIVQQLRDTGKVTRGYLGVAVQSVTVSSAAAAGLAATDGVVVQQVTPGSPAAQAGVQPGDVGPARAWRPSGAGAHAWWEAPPVGGRRCGVRAGPGG